MTVHEFDALLQKPPEVQVAYIVVPFDVREIFWTKAQIKVRGTIDGAPYRSSIQPMGDGNHAMIVTKAIMTNIGKAPGDRVHVVMDADTEERVVSVPNDLQQALEGDGKAKSAFNTFSYSQRKLYADWIEGAKKAETRVNRIQKAIEKIARGEKFS
jgi:hypothetical protein